MLGAYQSEGCRPRMARWCRRIVTNELNETSSNKGGFPVPSIKRSAMEKMPTVIQSTCLAMAGLLALFAVGCSTTATPAPVTRTTVAPSPTPKAPPVELLRLAHQQMNSVGSFRAYIDMKIVAEDHKAVIALNVSRGQPGLESVVMTVDAPGTVQRYEMILQQSYFYIKDDAQQWVRHNFEDMTTVGSSSSWAVDVASSIDFFGNLLPSEDVPWDIYDVTNVGDEEVGGVPVEHLKLGTNFRDMWGHIRASGGRKLIVASVLGISPEELLKQAEEDKLDLWIDDRGYVRQSNMEITLTGGRLLSVKMRGYDFDRDVTVQRPMDGGEVVADSTSSTSMFREEMANETPSPNQASQEVADEVPETTPQNASVSTAPLTGSARAMTREEVQASLGLGISLDRQDLSGADLTHMHLNGANFQDADLRDTDFYAADLSQADLRGANLAGADLTRANLRLADLRRAHLDGADLTRLDIEAGNLTEIELAGSDLNRSYMLNANLTRANLEGAKLNRTYLAEATLAGANLRGADLTDTDLTNADLTNADLSDATLSGATLSGAKLTGTILFGADLRDADLSGASLIRVELSAAELGGSDETCDEQGSGSNNQGSNSSDSSCGGAETTISGTFFDRNTSWKKAFCGEVHRCTREVLLERGALLGGI